MVGEHLAKINPDYYKDEIRVFNKVDLVSDASERLFVTREFPDAILVSALQNIGLDELKSKITAFSEKQRYQIKIYLPYREGKILAELQKQGEIISIEYEPEYLEICTIADHELSEKLKAFTVPIGKKEDDENSI